MEDLKIKNPKYAAKILCIALIICLVSSVGASLIQTNFGKVDVNTFRIPTNNGRYLSINVFKPDSATTENPAPCIIASPGTYNSKEMQDVAAVEFSRRGFVVITFDPYFHGHSSSTEDSYKEMPYSLSGGQIELVEYAHDFLDYVDSDRIGVTGHSMGGRISLNTANYYSGLVADALAAAAEPDSEEGETVTEQEAAEAWSLMKLKASFPVGAQTTDAVVEKKILCNAGVANGIYDEGPTRGDPTLSGEEKLVNTGLPEEEWVTVETLELGKYYGNASDGTLRVAYREPEIHPWNHFSHATANDMITFFYKALEVGEPVDPDNQIWLLKELFNGLGIIGLFMMIAPLASLLLQVPCFEVLQHKEPARLPALTTKRGKTFFWGGWAISWIASGLSLFPISLLSNKVFPVNISGNSVTANLFPMNINNGIWFWATFNAIVGIILFIVSYKLNGKESGVTPEMWGIKSSVKEVFHYLVLALCLYAVFYLVVIISDKLFVTDYRLWILAIKTAKTESVIHALGYCVLFFPFYLVNSILVNSANRVDGQKERVNLLICGFGNILGILIPVIIQYSVLFATGKVAFKNWNMPLLQASGLCIWLFLAAIVGRKLFRLTGKVWLGAMVNCLVIVSIGCFNTMLHIPL